MHAVGELFLHNLAVGHVFVQHRPHAPPYGCDPAVVSREGGREGREGRREAGREGGGHERQKLRAGERDDISRDSRQAAHEHAEPYSAYRSRPRPAGASPPLPCPTKPCQACLLASLPPPAMGGGTSCANTSPRNICKGRKFASRRAETRQAYAKA